MGWGMFTQLEGKGTAFKPWLLNEASQMALCEVRKGTSSLQALALPSVKGGKGYEDHSDLFLA